MTLPAWERLRASDRRALQVGPLQRVEVDLLRVVDGDLPDLDGATVFDAWTDPSGYAGARPPLVPVPVSVLAAFAED